MSKFIIYLQRLRPDEPANVPAHEPRRGQMLLVVAVAMVALLAMAGLAVDGGVTFARKAQLDRAVDAAVLAGAYASHGKVPNVEADAEGSNEVAQQIMFANGISPLELPTGATMCPYPDANGIVNYPVNFWTNRGMCGRIQNGAVPGALQYAVDARWESQTFFLRLVGIETVTLRSSATAEYFPLVDIVANGTGADGVMRTSQQSIFGPDLCPNFGDPFTPTNQGGGDNPDWARAQGRYTYRILIPQSYVDTYLASAATGNQPIVRVELWDPDTHNSYSGTSATADSGIFRTTARYTRTGVVSTGTSCNRKNGCLPTTGEPEGGNRFWFLNSEENRGNGGAPGTCTEPGSYTQAYNTTTLYRLYYYRQRADGSIYQVDLAHYIGRPDNNDRTDMHWVSPTENPNERMRAAAGIDMGQISPDAATAVAAAPVDPSRPGARANSAKWYAYPNATSGPLLCNSDMDGDQVHDQAGTPPANTRYCFLADTNGDGAINSGDAEPATALPQGAADPDFDCFYWAEQAVNGITINGKTITLNTTGEPECQGDGDFIVNVATGKLPEDVPDAETPDIYIDPGSRARYLYLDVVGLDGYSENNFEMWAGPPKSVYEVPSEVNARNMFVLNQIFVGQTLPSILHPHSSDGVVIYGLGRLPMNSNTANRVDIPLAAVSGQFAGQNIRVSLFDADAGAAGPIYFFFDTIPVADWAVCFGDSEANCQTTDRSPGVDWAKPRLGADLIPNSSTWATYNFELPSRAPSNPTFYSPVNFYGGIMNANYQAGGNDTYGWEITMESRPYLVE